jgi:hypothetical protein
MVNGVNIFSGLLYDAKIRGRQVPSYTTLVVFFQPDPLSINGYLPSKELIYSFHPVCHM